MEQGFSESAKILMWGSKCPPAPLVPPILITICMLLIFKPKSKVEIILEQRLVAFLEKLEPGVLDGSVRTMRGKK